MVVTYPASTSIIPDNNCPQYSTMAVESNQASTASSGAAFTWILEHLMAYPGSYEIPLRTMYTLNSNPTARLSSQRGVPHPSKHAHNALARSASLTDDGQHTDEGASTEAAQFKANLMSQVARLPSQPFTLPPSFTTSFIRRCFAPEIEEVDFPQALTALDYLKDIETRRRGEVLSALKRLGIDKQTASDRDELGKTYPGVLSWITTLEEKEKKIEALYSQIYIGLRRWILINEMLWEPFHKANCLFMLNTLYPPTNPPQYTQYITDTILAAHRQGFSQYIFAIEKQGTKILDPLIKQGIREGEVNGWPSVRETLDKYLRMANGVIEECCEINGKDSFEGDERMRKSRKVDSGVSFASSEGQSISAGSRSSRGSMRSSTTSVTKASKPAPSPVETKDLKPAGSTLDRIAKELRKMRSRGDIRDSKDTPSKSKTVKKMKSAGILGDRDKNLGSSASDPPPFDVDEFKRKRMIWEAQNAKKHNSR